MRMFAAFTGLSILILLSACSESPGATVATVAPPSTVAPKMKAVTLSASTVGGLGQVVYSCAHYADVKVCGPDTVDGVWTRKIEFPEGTKVRVQVSGGALKPTCWISDETGTMTYDKDTESGDCEAVVE